MAEQQKQDSGDQGKTGSTKNTDPTKHDKPDAGTQRPGRTEPGSPDVDSQRKTNQ